VFGSSRGIRIEKFQRVSRGILSIWMDIVKIKLWMFLKFGHNKKQNRQNGYVQYKPTFQSLVGFARQQALGVFASVTGI
jgi:hypothetical protein